MDEKTQIDVPSEAVPPTPQPSVSTPLEEPITPTPKPSPKSKLVPVLVIFLLITLGLAGFFAYKYVQNSKTPIPATTATPDPVATETIQPEQVVKRVYVFTPQLKDPATLPPVGEPDANGPRTLAVYITKLLGLNYNEDTVPAELPPLKVYYNTSLTTPYGTESNLFVNPLYILLDQPAALKSSYADNYLTATVTPAEELLTYLVKNDYCTSDSECSIRSAACTYGAFNNYQVYIDPPWGCGPGGYKEGTNYTPWGTYSEELSCETEMEFGGSKCLQNTCVETEVKQVCQS